MIQTILISLLSTFSIIFLNLTHPLSMGLTLLIQTILISLISGILTKSFWYSYILFLIFLGGMLVLFIYVTSLASNEMFKLSIKLTIFSMSFFSLLSIIFLILDNSMTSFFSLNNEMEMISSIFSYINENSLSLNKLYNYPSNLITILLMNYLLITLIIVVKITKFSKGPLRLMT